MIGRLFGAKAMRMFSVGLIMQTLLSAANFAVGLILIRRTANLQYGYYVLVANGLLLLTAIQGAFLQPQTVIGLTRLDAVGRSNLVGGMVRVQRMTLPWIFGLALLMPAALWFTHLLSLDLALLLSLALLAATATLGREFFRMVLFAYHQPLDVLQADVVYVLLLVAGAFVATLTPKPAHIAVVTLALAAWVGGLLLARRLWRHEAWNIRGADHILRQILPLGGWSVTGAAIHWILSQGYSYLVAGMVDVRAVAALAATRLTMVPIFVLSGGVGTVLFPLTSGWVHRLGVAAALRRLALLALGLILLAACYFGLMWYLRDWVFSTILKKQFAQRDTLLLLWGAVFMVTLCRDQFINLLAARERFRYLTLMTTLSTLLWLVCSYAAMKKFGAAGAVMGILIGESVNVLGIMALIFREMRATEPAA